MDETGICGMWLRGGNFSQSVDFLNPHLHFFLHILLRIIPGSNGCYQVTLPLSGYVYIGACEQVICFFKELSFHNKVGLACIRMVSKALSVFKEVVPPGMQLAAGGGSSGIICIPYLLHSRGVGL